MKEIEVKILNVDADKIREKLKELGAEKVSDGKVHSVAMDFPDGRLEKNGELLRVRKAGERIELCYKGKNESTKFKTKEEIQVTTSSFEDTMSILEKLGFKKIYDSEKRRESYKLGTVGIEIDTYSNIPTYVEIEAPTEEEVTATVQKLGFTMEQTSILSAEQLLKAAKK